MSIMVLALFLVAARPEVGAAVEAAMAVPALAQAQWGCVVVDLDSGAMLYEHQADKLFIPASNMKLLTAAAALLRLGAETRLQTVLLRDAQGDLILRGGGDPSLRTEDLEDMAGGVRGPVRDVLVDDSALLQTPLGPGWAWDDESYDYSARVSALSVNENVETVTVRPALAQGCPPFVGVEPDAVLRFHNQASSGEAAAEDTLSVERDRDEARVVGTVPAGGAVEARVTVADPARYAGTLLRRALQHHGVMVRGTLRSGAVPANAEVVARHQSAALFYLVRHMLEVSDNLYAELFLRLLDPPGDGLHEAAKYLGPFGFDGRVGRWVDGSGLSRMNLISPRQILLVLAGMRAVPAFVQALPVLGQSGTLAGRLRNSPLRGRVLAKTGSMSGVSSLSGYVLDKQGHARWAFSLLINNFTCPSSDVKAVEDRFLETLAKQLY